MRSLHMLIAGTFVAAAATLMTGSDARSDTTYVGAGTSVLGDKVPADQVEFLSTPEHILGVVTSSSPSLIWETLEHGEKVECLQCIPAVAGLLYAQDSQTREIAAWWLRRRIFGVFGPNEVYQQTMNTLASDPDPTRRAAAAYALGEFLASDGIQPLATAIATDKVASVRAAAASALGRMNSAGNGGLSTGMKDSDPSVRIASLKATARVNEYTDEATPAGLLGDGVADVRRLAVQVLENLHAKDTVASVITLAQSDADATVRMAACHALGVFGDPSAKTALSTIVSNDTSSLVRDAAAIALRNL